MRRDDPTAVLVALLRRVPVHAIDRDAARRQGDETALAYAQAMTKWRAEAALAIADVEQGSTARHRPAWPSTPHTVPTVIEMQARS